MNDPNTSSGANHPDFREALRAGARPIPSSRSGLFRAFDARWTLFGTSRAMAAMTAPTVLHRRPLSHPAMPRRRRVLGQVQRLRQRSTRRRARHQRLREQLKAHMAVTQRIRRCRARGRSTTRQATAAGAMTVWRMVPRAGCRSRRRCQRCRWETSRLSWRSSYALLRPALQTCTSFTRPSQTRLASCLVGRHCTSSPHPCSALRRRVRCRSGSSSQRPALRAKPTAAIPRLAPTSRAAMRRSGWSEVCVKLVEPRLQKHRDAERTY